MKPPAFRFPVPSPVKSFRMVMALRDWRETAVQLPLPLLWALALNEGDEVTAEPLEAEQWRFRPSRQGRAEVRTLTLGPDGALDLEGLFDLDEPLILRAESDGWSEAWFTLSPAKKRQVAPEVAAVALYSLTVEPGCQVTLPADAVWALTLASGDALTGRTVMWTLEGESPPKPTHPLKLSIGAGGTLPLPESLLQYQALQPGSDIPFEVVFTWDSSRFRLEPDLGRRDFKVPRGTTP